MKTRFSIETTTGAVTRFINDKQLAPEQALLLTARDILHCEVVFTAGGEDITAEILPDNWALHLGLRYRTSVGAILAQSEPHTMAAGVANCILSLDTAEIDTLVNSNLLADTLRSVVVYFEVEVTDSYVDAEVTARQTFTQQQFRLQFEVNEEGDEPPPAAAVSAETARSAADRAEVAATAAEEAVASLLSSTREEIVATASHAALRAVATNGAATRSGTTRLVLHNGAVELWSYALSAAADDDSDFIRPIDYVGYLWLKTL